MIENINEPIAMKQADWEALEHQRGWYIAKLDYYSQIAEMLYDSEEKTRYLDWVSHLEEALEEINRMMLDLENWLLDHNAPGWVAT